MANDPQESVFTEPELSQSTQQDGTRPATAKSSKGRMVMILGGGALLVVVLAVAYSMFSGKKPAPMEGGALPDAPNVRNIPGGPNQDQTYGELTEEENRRRAERAGTSMPVLRADEDPQVVDPFRDMPTVPPPPPVEQVPVVPEVVEPEPVPVVQPEPVVQAPPAPAYPTYSQEQYATMAAALQSYLLAWQAAPQPIQEFNYNGSDAKKEDPAAGNAVGAYGNVAGGNASGSPSSQARTNEPSFIRAGTVVPALLMGSLSSDSPGPVLAQITSGPLSGTRLIGSFSSTGKVLMIKFSTLSKPGMGTFGVNAVAVDDNYSTGLATDVNNHSIRRFVLPTLAAFIKGYGEAYGRSGSTVVIGPGGSTITQDALTAEQARRAALGEAGTIMTENLTRAGDIPPTVKVDCEGGCPIGLLFLSDL